MASLVGSILLSTVFYLVTAKPAQSPHQKIPLLMPGVQPQIPDTYLCYPTKVEKNAVYITGFNTVANSSTAHHILLYGCEEPGNEEKVWNCGEMASENPQYSVGPVCKEGAKIVYAWAMDAPQLNLPKDVAFKVGGKSPIKWLVLQVHYKDVSSFVAPQNGKDHSGIILDTTSKPQPKTAGVYLLGTGGELAPHSTIYMETACSQDDPMTIHPFAFRTHAHSHGEVVSGYRVRDGKWEEIGRMSPKKPQMFYNISHPGMIIKPGDIMAARCTMVNNENRTIEIGSTQKDEMCNFYIMYWVNGDKILSEEYCFSDGPPNWSWSNMEELQIQNAPQNASVIPGTDKILEATEAFAKAAESQIERTEEEIEKEILKWLAMYDEEAFENYMYNLLFPQRSSNEYENNIYPQGSNIDQEDPARYYYNSPMAKQGYYPGIVEENDSVNDQQQQQPIDQEELEALLSQLTPEQLQRYYNQLQEAEI